jgi:hypothetical protein
VHDREVVADEEAGETQPVLQVGEQLEDGGLDGDVQRAGRLVGDQQRRVQRQRAGQGDALPLAAGQLARPPIGVRRRQLHRVQQVAHLDVPFGAGADPMHVERFPDALGDGEPGIQGGLGVLVHEGQAATQLAPLGTGGDGHVVPREPHPALGQRHQPGGEPAEGGLARAGLADQAEHLAGGDREGHVVDGREGPAAAAGSVVDVDAVELQGRRAGVSRLEALGVLRRDVVRVGQPQHRGQQGPGVGLARPDEQCARLAGLDDVARLQHHHPVGDLGDHAHVVGDQHDRRTGPVADPAQQPQDLRLHRDVERGGRLVGEQQLRLVGERQGQHHALFLSARQLVRVVAEPVLGVGDLDLPQQLEAALAHRAARGGPMGAQRLLELPADGAHRVERGVRLLEDHRDPAAPDVVELPLGELQEVVAVVPDRSGGASAGRQQAEDRPRGHRLAGAGLTDQGEHLTRTDPHGHVLDGGAGVGERDGQAIDLEKGGGVRHDGPPRGTGR